MRGVAGVATLAIMPVLSGPDPIHLPSLLRMSDAVAAGLTADQVRQRVRSGRWQAMARGTYLRHTIDGDDPFEVARTEHAVRARAAAMTHAASVIALGSAAAVHQLPIVSAVPQHVHLISAFGRAGVRAGVNIHPLPLEPADIDVCRGPVTTVLRTWTDITRTGSLADSLAFGDAAYRRGLLDGSHLVELAETATGRGHGESEWRRASSTPAVRLLSSRSRRPASTRGGCRPRSRRS